jgi:hypothetical protein
MKFTFLKLERIGNFSWSVMITEEMFAELYQYTEANLIYGKKISADHGSEIYLGVKKADQNGIIPPHSCVIKKVEAWFERDTFARELREVFAPLMNQMMQKCPDFLAFDHFCVKYPEQIPNQTTIYVEFLVAYPAYGKSLDGKIPQKDYGAPVPDIGARNLWDAEEFVCLREFLLRCLARLRETQLVHRDIKPANILKDPIKPNFKLIDFDSSRVSMSKHTTLKSGYSPRWASPRLLSHQGRTVPYELWEHNDHYCAGLTLLALGCQLSPTEIQAAKQDPILLNTFLQFLGERYTVKSREIVKDLLDGVYSFQNAAPCLNYEEKIQSLEVLVSFFHFLLANGARTTWTDGETNHGFLSPYRFEFARP